MSKISQLVDFAKNDTTNTDKEISLSNVPNFIAQDINAKTKVKAYGAMKILSAQGIRHALAGHGNDKLERERGQIGIVDADFELIPEILNNSDEIIEGNKNNNGRSNCVAFIKRIKNINYTVVMCITSDGEKFIFTTMFKRN